MVSKADVTGLILAEIAMPITIEAGGLQPQPVFSEPQLLGANG